MRRCGSTGLQEPLLPGFEDDFDARVGVQLQEQVVDVVLHRGRSNVDRLHPVE